jgi:hypothetical protein
MGAAGSFLSGFLGRANTVHAEDRAEAKDFFSKQMELARTKGLENRLKTKQAADAGVSVANQLMQMGAPKDLVLAVANQNPDDLPALAKTVAEYQKIGVTTDETFFRDAMQTSAEVNPGNTDIVGFFNKLYEPLRNSVEADPENYKRDRRGTFWSAVMGGDQMERARARLGETIVADGLTAEELLAYSDTPTPGKPLGDITVTLDNNMLGELERTQQAKFKGGDDLTIAETASVMKTFNDFKGEIGAQLEAETGENYLDDGEKQKVVAKMAAQKTVEMYSANADQVAQIPSISQWLVEDEEESPAAEGVKALPEKLPTGETLIKDLGDGNSMWLMPDGSKKMYINSTIQ